MKNAKIPADIIASHAQAVLSEPRMSEIILLA